MSNWQYAQVVPTYNWRSAMTIPRELSLLKGQDNYVLRSRPIQEMDVITGGPVEIDGNLPDSAFRLDLKIDWKYQYFPRELAE